MWIERSAAGSAPVAGPEELQRTDQKKRGTALAEAVSLDPDRRERREKPGDRGADAEEHPGFPRYTQGAHTKEEIQDTKLNVVA